MLPGLIIPAFSSGLGTLTAVSAGAGTAIGTMTGNGGLAASFDGTTNQAFAAASGTPAAGNTGYVGKDWGSGNTKLIGSFTAYSTNDAGFNAISGNTITLSLEGSTDNFSSSIVTLFTGSSFTDANSLTKTYTYPTDAIDVSTPYRYHRLKVFSNSASFIVRCAELQFSEFL